MGPEGAWAQACFDKGVIDFGYDQISHDLCMVEDWAAVSEQLKAMGRGKSKVTDGIREIRDFYALGADVLWVTIANSHLWWAFATPDVEWLAPRDGRGSRFRRTVDGWHNTDISGVPLRLEQLSSRLTQVAGYRQTICAVKAKDYLLRRLNALEDRLMVKANLAKRDLIDTAQRMIEGLHWADFELFIDLLFARSGWQRRSILGGQMADADLILEQPTIEERAFVQIKSTARQRELDDYLWRFRNGGYDRFFFICHSPIGDLKILQPGKNLHLWTGQRLAQLALDLGLTNWLVEKSQ